MRPIELAASFGEGLGYGVVIGPLSAEILAHRQAHRTDELVSPVREMAEVALWAVGSDPTTFSIEHRKHHHEEVVYPPGSIFHAFKKTLGDSYVSRRHTKNILADEELHGALVFQGLDPANDPILKYDEAGKPVGVKRTIVGEALTKLPEPLSNLAIPSLLVAARYRRYMNRHSEVPMPRALAWYSGFLLGSSLAALYAGMPEHKEGGPAPTAGKDMRPKALHLIVPSASFRHKSHHEAPAQRDTPGAPPYSIDIVYTRILDKLKLLKQDRTQL
ncbi:MAG TPA: hypothetical protein VK694_04035 [Verrucomicrobiae bacterium]|nr:hypothetical protein [Verrucomicrobiae bacterium]